MYLYLVGYDIHLLQDWQAAHLALLGADVWNASTTLDIEPTEITDNDITYTALVNLYTQ